MNYWINISDDILDANDADLRHHIACQITRAKEETMDPVNVAYVDAAQDHPMVSDELEVDGSAVVSPGDDAGAYVMAWLWVEDTDVDFAAHGATPPGEENED